MNGFAEAFYTHFSGQSDLFRSATISVIDTRKTEDIARLVRHLSRGRLLSSTAGLQEYDRKTPHLFYDLGDCLHALAHTQEEHLMINETLKRVVLYKRDTGRIINLTIRRHSGLSIFVPLLSLPHLTEAYRQTAWGQLVLSSM